MVSFDFVLGHKIFLAEILDYKTEKKVNDIKIMYGNCGLRNEYERDLRSSEHYLTISENKVWSWIHELCNTGAVLYQPS